MAITKFTPPQVPFEASPNLRAYLDNQLRRLADLINNAVQTEEFINLDVADSQLSSNIPRLNLNNVFTGPQQLIQAANPHYQLYDTTAAANGGRWQWRIIAGDMYLRMLNDNQTVAETPIRILRAGTTASTIDLTSTVVTSQGVFRAPAGEPAAPAYSFINSPNTGIYLSGVDMRFACNGGLDFLIEQSQIRSINPIKILERAAAVSDSAGYGQLWVKNTTPCQLWFTDDAGTDTQIV